MAHPLTTLSSRIALVLAFVASTGAVGCVTEVTDENGAEITAEKDVCEQEGATQGCTPEGSSAANSGVQSCVLDDDGDLVWSQCNEMSAGSTPLVLSFDNAPVTFAATAGAFDLTGTMSATTDWPTAATPWLALDRDGNGSIDDGRELFGSATVLNHGGRAENGFIALAELDSNGDGRITEADAAFSSLLVWSDKDGDRVSSAGELAPITSLKLVSIDLAYTNAPRCDARGNCAIERASFRFRSASGEERTGTVIDVHLKFQ